MQLVLYNGIKNINLVLCEVFVEKFQKSNNFEFIVLLITLTKGYIIDLTEELGLSIELNLLCALFKSKSTFRQGAQNVQLDFKTMNSNRVTFLDLKLQQ